MTSHEQTQYQKEAMRDRGIEWRLNPEDTLEKIEELLRGKRLIEVWDKKQQSYVTRERSFGKPLLNENGVQGAMRELRSRVSKTNIQAHTDKEDLMSYMLNTHKHLSALFMSKFHSWGLESLADYHQVVNMCSDAIFFALTRTIDDLERKHNSESLEVRETITDQEGGWLWG